MIRQFFYICILTILTAIIPDQLYSQELLGKTTDEIRQFITEQTDKFEEKGDTLSFECVEQDDLGRLFDIQYRFIQENGKCVSYLKQFPLHSFWIQRLLEKVDILEGKKDGEAFEIEGEMVYPSYRFDSYCLKVESNQEYLKLFWHTAQ